MKTPTPADQQTLLRARLNRQTRILFSGHDDAKTVTTELGQALYDVVIIGGGPAGLSAAAECSRLRLKTLLLEKGLLLDTLNTFAVPDHTVQEWELDEAVDCRNPRAWFRDYMGLDSGAPIDYCILAPEKALFTLAARIDPAYCTIIDNCELTAFVREEGCWNVKTVLNDCRLLPYRDACSQAPRSLALSGIDRWFYDAHNPWVCVNAHDEINAVGKHAANPKFRGKYLLDTAGWRSPLANAYKRQRSCKAWKCLVYEFTDVEMPDRRQVIFDLAVPTETGANFWFDRRGDHTFSVGVMVLTSLSPGDAEAQPSRTTLGRYMSTWLNISRCTGKLVRERFGLIPMTDFLEPAVRDGIGSAGVAATRVVPNTGFGFATALEQGRRLARHVAEISDTKGRTLTLNNFDECWVADNETKTWLNLLFQDLHEGYSRDTYFHELSVKSLSLSPEEVKRRIVDLLDDSDLRILARFFVKNRELLSPDRLDPAIYPHIIDHASQFFVCVFTTWLGFYTPLGNPCIRPGVRGIIKNTGLFFRRTAWFALIKGLLRIALAVEVRLRPLRRT